MTFDRHFALVRYLSADSVVRRQEAKDSDYIMSDAESTHGVVQTTKCIAVTVHANGSPKNLKTHGEGLGPVACLYLPPDLKIRRDCLDQGSVTCRLI